MKYIYSLLPFSLIIFLTILVSSCSKEDEQQDDTSSCQSITIVDGSEFDNIPYTTTIHHIKEEDGCLVILIGYSGCGEQDEIPLFAQDGILKSDPPQINLALIEGDITECLAYFESEFSYDLSKIDNILGNEKEVWFNFVNSEERFFYVRD